MVGLRQTCSEPHRELNHFLLMIPAPNISLLAILPLLILTGTAVLVMLADLWTEGPDREGLGWIGLVGLTAAAVAAIALWNTHESSFADAVIIDRYGLFFTLLFCVASAL